jgi:hypothetical protein
MRFWIEPWALEHPVFRSPVRLGLVIHLVAFARPDDPVVVVDAREMALKMDIRRNALDTAFHGLQQAGIVRLQKGVPKKGLWTVDLSLMGQFMWGSEWLKAPIDIPAELMMKEWSEGYLEAMGRPWMRTKGGFWAERNQWVSLLEHMDRERVSKAIASYLSDPEARRMGCSLKYFILTAPSLDADHARGEEAWRFRSSGSRET